MVVARSPRPSRSRPVRSRCRRLSSCRLRPRPHRAASGSSSSAISVTVTDANGNLIHSFTTPLAIAFSNVPTDFSPTTSEDGTTWTPVPACAANAAPTTLPAGTDCYTRSGTTLTIYTVHLSLFAVQQQARRLHAARHPVGGRPSAQEQGARRHAEDNGYVARRPDAPPRLDDAENLAALAPHFGQPHLDALGDRAEAADLRTDARRGRHRRRRWISQTIKIPVPAQPKTHEDQDDHARRAWIEDTHHQDACSARRRPARLIGLLPASVSKQLPVEASGVAATATAAQIFVIGGHGSYQVLAGSSAASLHRVASLPMRLTSPIAIAIPARQAVYVIGGERGTTPTSRIFRIDLSTHKVTEVGRFVEPLAESAVVQQSNAAYIIGGWTGHKYATAILYFTAPARVSLVARLPVGLRVLVLSPAARRRRLLAWLPGRNGHGPRTRLGNPDHRRR